MPWRNNWPTSTRESIFNWEKKKKKSVKSRKTERKPVCNSTVSSINWPKCRPNSKEPTIITTSFKDIKWRVKSNTRYCKNNTRIKRKKPTTSWNVFSKHKKNWINWIERSSKLKSTMKLWNLKLLLHVELLIELKNLWSILKSKRKDKIPWLIPWTRKSRDWMSKRRFIKLNWSRKKKKLLLLGILLRRLLLKSRKLSCQRKLFWMIGRSLFSVCNREIKLCKLLRNSSNKSKMTSFKLNLRFLESEMKPEKSKRKLKIYPTVSKKWKVMKNSWKRDNKKSKTRKRD